MNCVEAAWASSAARHRQIPDEKHVGFLPCARPARRAHLAEATRLARHRRHLIPDLAAASTTNVNFPITSVVELPRRIGYTCLCRRRSIGTTRPGGDPVPIEQAGVQWDSCS